MFCRRSFNYRPSHILRDLKPSRLTLAKMGLETTRCRGRQIFRGAKDFVRICSNLPEKCVSQTWLGPFFGSHTKKVFMCIMETKKVKFKRISRVSLIHHTMRAKASKHLCEKFADFFVFSGIFPGLLTNQNFWGSACTPLHPRLLHHCRNWPRDQASRLRHCYLWSEYRSPTNSLKISMQYSC